MKRLNLFFAMGIMLLLTPACQKDDSSSNDNDIILSQQESVAEEVMLDIDGLVDEAIDLNSGELKSAALEGDFYITNCPVITINTQSSPQVLTIDFGTACTGKDGKVRSGKIIVSSESFTTFPSVRDKTFDNFYVDGKKVNGNITKTISKDYENHVRTAQISEDVTISFPNNTGSAHRVANLTREYDKGMPGRSDNQIVSWGTVAFTRMSGTEVTKTVSANDPLVFKTSCHHIVSGIITFQTSNNHSWTIDYGNGECDNLATLTIGDQSREIRIR
jgi:hypothetical protein